MKFCKKILFIFFFLLIKTSLFANESIVFINVDLLFEKSNLGKSITSSLDKKNLKNDETLKLKKKELIKEENELKKLKNIVSSEEFNSKLLVLKNKVNSYNLEKDQLYKEFIKTKNSELRNFFDKINPLLETYLNEQKIDILLDKKNVFIGRSSHDITAEVIEIINKKFR